MTPPTICTDCGGRLYWDDWRGEWVNGNRVDLGPDDRPAIGPCLVSGVRCVPVMARRYADITGTQAGAA